jgi:Fic family protein
MEQHPAPVAAALAHFGLISIHPFDDGNGRTARLVADMVLDLKGWSIDGMLAISKVMLDRRSDYYAALREAQGEEFTEDVNVTPFVRFHTHALAGAAALLEERVITFNKRRDAWIKQIDLLNPRQVTALMFVLDIGPLSSSVYARLTRSSQATALADLSQLLSLDVVVREGAGRNTRYRLHPRLARITQGGSEGGDTQ